MIGHVHDRIIQVLALTDGLLLLHVAKKDFISNPHHSQTKCRMGTHMSKSCYTC